jgi:hypothetical protein
MVLALLVVLAAFGIWIYGLADVVRDRNAEPRTLSQGVWAPIVFLGFAPAALAWLVLGRPRATAGIPGSPGIPAPRRDVVPETSEEFQKRVRARAEEQRRRYLEQRQTRPE